MSREDVVAEHRHHRALGHPRVPPAPCAMQKAQLAPELIGQFGVGFYSSFMVAERITRRHARAPATEDGHALGVDRRRRLSPRRRRAADAPGPPSRCTSSPRTRRTGSRDYTGLSTCCKDIVKQYSDFVSYPMRLKGETLNSMKAIWARRQGRGHRGRAPRVLQAHHATTGTIRSSTCWCTSRARSRRARSLYMPSKAPFDLFIAATGERRGRRSSTSSACSSWTTGEELLPPYLRFVRGVVASDDLLAERLARDPPEGPPDPGDPQAPRRGGSLGRAQGDEGAAGGQVPDVLARVRRRPQGRAARLRRESGPHPGAGAGGVHRVGRAGRASPRSAEYVGRMKDGQAAIYYMTAATRSAAERSPHLEALPRRGLRGPLLHRSGRRAVAAG